MHKQSRGFSLIELAIVLTVIGLLVGTVVAGNKLLGNSALLTSIKELQTYQTAINGFQEQYRYWPGDMPNATSLWSGTANGDGNEKIFHPYQSSVSPNEIYLVWQHLMLARYIEGSYTGTGPVGTPGVNVPTSAHKPESEGYMLSYEHNVANPTYPDTYAGPESMDFYLRLAATSSGTAILGGALTAQEAYSMDKKMDDGNPSTGVILGTVGLGATGTCRSGSYPTATYSLNLTTLDCQLLYRLKNKR